MTKTGPNQSCPCGSGKKYKKCCRSKHDQEAQERRAAANGAPDDVTKPNLDSAAKNGTFLEFAVPLLRGVGQENAEVGLERAVRLFNVALDREKESARAKLTAFCDWLYPQVKPMTRRMEMELVISALVVRHRNLYPCLYGDAPFPEVHVSDGWVFAGPAALLIDLGFCSHEATLIDYAGMGMSQATIPDLVRIIECPDLWVDTHPRHWARVHAWRALGQLQALTMIPMLVQLVRDRSDDDLVVVDLPCVFGRLGAPCLGAMHDLAIDQAASVRARMVGACTLALVGMWHEALREECRLGLIEYLRVEPDDGHREWCARVLVGDLPSAEGANAVEEAIGRGRIRREEVYR